MHLETTIFTVNFDVSFFKNASAVLQSKQSLITLKCFVHIKIFTKKVETLCYGDDRYKQNTGKKNPSVL